MVKRQLPLADVVLEKGTRLMIPVWALHMDPEYWPEPALFDPTRFTEENKKTRHPAVYMPFGDGPRICIGEHAVAFALFSLGTRGFTPFGAYTLWAILMPFGKATILGLKPMLPLLRSLEGHESCIPFQRKPNLENGIKKLYAPKGHQFYTFVFQCCCFILFV